MCIYCIWLSELFGHWIEIIFNYHSHTMAKGHTKWCNLCCIFYKWILFLNWNSFLPRVRFVFLHHTICFLVCVRVVSHSFWFMSWQMKLMSLSSSTHYINWSAAPQTTAGKNRWEINVNNNDYMVCLRTQWIAQHKEVKSQIDNSKSPIHIQNMKKNVIKRLHGHCFNHLRI